MKVNATAYLYYNEGESMSSGWESLWLYVKFKREGKLFNTKLRRELISTYNVANRHLCDPEDRIETYDDYYRLVDELIAQREHFKEVAEEMVKEYFKGTKILDDSKKSKQELITKIDKLPAIEVTVEIK